jgi:Fe-Mn family superoxide dismutase
MAFELPPLPYSKSALEPHMSVRTLEFHYSKHHQAYVTNLNNLVLGTPLAAKPLETIIKETAKDESAAGIFNNAAQVWNHTFFWNSMKPAGGGAPTGDLAHQINHDFGSVDKFKERFRQAAVGQFGSGWAWLVADKGELKVVKTANAATPITQGQIPLLTCDVWEHAYYLDYQNRRPDFVHTFLEQLVNWDFAATNLAHAKSK